MEPQFILENELKAIDNILQAKAQTDQMYMANIIGWMTKAANRIKELEAKDQPKAE
jgi:hypothetical protein